MNEGEPRPKVLVVDDESPLADAYADVLSDEYQTEVAYDGEEALEKIDNEFDAVLLDRRMPGLSGKEVLDEIRSMEVNCGIAMVTAVEPDFDIVEMGFDDYVVKPVRDKKLHETVENIKNRSGYEEHLREYISNSTKQATLEAIMDENELENSEEFQEMKDDIKEMSMELGDITEELSEEEFSMVLENIIQHMDRSPDGL